MPERNCVTGFPVNRKRACGDGFEQANAGGSPGEPGVMYNMTAPGKPPILFGDFRGAGTHPNTYRA